MKEDSPQRLSRLGAAVLLSLYFSQGFPAGLLAHVLPAVLREQGVGLEYLGLLKLLALPWLLKFIWAPWVDRHAPWDRQERFGRSRSWIIPLQVLATSGLLLLALLPPGDFAPGLWPAFLLCILLLNFSASTQDIATDGLAVRVLPRNRRGLGNALQVGGYKLGMILSSSSLLIAIGLFGWTQSLMAMAALMVLLWLPIILFREPETLQQEAAFDGGHGVGLSLSGYWKQYRGFVLRPGLVAWLFILMAYKVPDGLASAMIKPLLVDQGLSLEQIGKITLISSLAGLLAVFAGGWWVDRQGAIYCLGLFAIIQALALGTLTILAESTPLWLVLLITAFEQVADALATVALFACMMHMCRRNHEGLDFTLQACLQILVVGFASVGSGFLASALGYDAVFLSAAILALLVAVTTFVYARRAWPTSDPLTDGRTVTGS